MNAGVPERSWQRALRVGLVYVGLGIGSAVVSNDLESAPVQVSVRVGILLLAVVVFYRHLRSELAASEDSLRSSAMMTSGALAFGTFLLAIYAVGSAWWDSSHVPTSLLLALLIWPVATGLPAFMAALVSGAVMIRVRARTDRL